LAVNTLRLAREFFSRIPSLTILDGIKAMEGDGPVRGLEKNLGLIIGGPDPVAVDSVASFIAGHEITYIKQARKIGIGESNIDKIEIIGVRNLESLVSPFKMHRLYSRSTFTAKELQILDEITRE
ncbi:MAG: DUF362 domain-containing protein, partial [Candidatus Helarchaeales archaeon]